jgi:hypothetical protein
MMKLPPEAKIRVTYHKNGRKVRVPFVCTNIAVPPVPEKTEATPSWLPEPNIPAGKHPLRVVFANDTLRNALEYLVSDVVQKELDLNDSQRRELDETVELNRGLSKYFDENPNLTNDEGVKKINEVDKKCVSKLEKLLTPARMDRLCEMITQIEGPFYYLCAYDRNKITKLFDLTPKQMKEVEKTFTDAQDAVQACCRPMENDSKEKSLSRQTRIEAAKKMQAIKKDANEKLLKIFAPKQLEKFNRLKGRKIDTEKAVEEMRQSY